MSKKDRTYVPIQKGRIEPNIPHTMKMMTSEDKVREDSRHDMERRDGQLMKFRMPS